MYSASRQVMWHLCDTLCEKCGKVPLQLFKVISVYKQYCIVSDAIDLWGMWSPAPFRKQYNGLVKRQLQIRVMEVFLNFWRSSVPLSAPLASLIVLLINTHVTQTLCAKNSPKTGPSIAQLLNPGTLYTALSLLILQSDSQRVAG